MFLKIEIRKKLSKNNKLRPFKVAICICDMCNHTFDCVNNVTKSIQKMYHFCSKKCSSEACKTGKICHQKSIKTCQQRYGVFSIMQLLTIKEKRQKRSLDRWGVAHPMQNHSLKEKRNRTVKNIYGVDFLFQSEMFSKRRHETMKRNGTYGKSKPEDRLYEILCEIFKKDNIERQKLVYKWPIDFYVKSIDTYVQYDGYWHGIGRIIDEVAEYKNKRDVNIHKKMLTDIKQNEFFQKHEMKLIRVKNLTQKQITVDVINQILNKD